MKRAEIPGLPYPYELSPWDEDAGPVVPVQSSLVQRVRVSRPIEPAPAGPAVSSPTAHLEPAHPADDATVRETSRFQRRAGRQVPVDEPGVPSVGYALTQRHLHLRAMDGPDPLRAAGLPIAFRGALSAGGSVVVGT